MSKGYTGSHHEHVCGPGRRAGSPLLLVATPAAGHLYGRYKEGAYLAPGKHFKMSSPFPDEPIGSDGRPPENNNAGAVSFIDMKGRLNGVLYMKDKDKTIARNGCGREQQALLSAADGTADREAGGAELEVRRGRRRLE